MARELSRTANFAAGTIIVQIDDEHGNVIPHTVNVLGVPDVDADIAAAIAAVDRAASAKAQIFAEVGFGNPTGAA